MTSPDRELIRRYVQAWRDGDQAAVSTSYSDDVVMHHHGAGCLTGTTRGKEELFAMIAKILELAPDTEILEPEFIAVGDGFAVIRAPEVFRDGDRSFRTERVVVYRLRDGHICEIWTYDGDQAGMGAFFDEGARRRGWDVDSGG